MAILTVTTPGSLNAAIDALATAARELRDAGTYGYLKQTVAGRQVAGEAFRP
jgi:hypothetical protein